MEELCYGVMAVVLIVAVVMDLREDRISNKWMCFGFFFALEYRFAKATGWFLSCETWLELWNLGLSGMGNALRYAFWVFLILFPLFCIKGIGGGDIKLLCIFSMFLPGQEIALVLGSFLVGGVLGIGKLIMNAWKGVKGKGETIHFSLAIAISVCMTFVLNYG